MLRTTDKRLFFKGPVPYNRSDRAIFHGRQAELQELTDLIQFNRLTVLSAESAVGKSSLLQAGLVPTLEDLDYFVVMIHDWPFREGITADELMISALASSLTDDPDLRAAIARETEPHQALTRLQESTGGREMIVIFDQSEELLRWRHAIGEAFLTRIGELYFTAPWLRMLLSLRSEWESKLRFIEERVGPLANMKHYLQPLTGARLKSALLEAVANAEVTIDAGALSDMVGWWEEARRSDDRYPASLLHFQALLESIYQQAVAERGSDIDAIEPDDVTSYLADRSPVAAIKGAVEDYVTRTFRTWLDEGVEADARRVAMMLAVRMAPHLSSGGFKLPREQLGLASISLRGELDALGIPDSWLREALQNVSELKERQAGLERTYVPRPKSLLPSHVDPDPELLAGEARNKDRKWAERTAQELVRAFVMAVDRLRDANICRTQASGDNQLMYELVHDGFGEAMISWAAAHRNDPELLLAAYTAQQSEHLQLQGLSFSDGRPRDIRNVVWRGCWISGGRRAPDEAASAPSDATQGDDPHGQARGEQRPLLTLQRLRFGNCDLRGSIFKFCRLEDVQFMGSNLSGAMFIDCEFENVVFNESLLHSVAFVNTHIRNCSFTESEAEGLQFRTQPVIGAPKFTATGVRMVGMALRGWWMSNGTMDVVVRSSTVNQMFAADDFTFSRLEFSGSQVMLSDLRASEIKDLQSVDSHFRYCRLPTSLMETDVSGGCSIYPTPDVAGDEPYLSSIERGHLPYALSRVTD